MLRRAPMMAASEMAIEERGSPIALTGVTPEELVARLPGVLLEDARRIVAAAHAGRDFAIKDGTIRRVARQAVVARGYVPKLTLLEQVQSSYDAFLKLVLK